jgi:hypothetical protein
MVGCGGLWWAVESFPEPNCTAAESKPMSYGYSDVDPCQTCQTVALGALGALGKSFKRRTVDKKLTKTATVKIIHIPRVVRNV